MFFNAKEYRVLESALQIASAVYLSQAEVAIHESKPQESMRLTQKAHECQRLVDLIVNREVRI